MSSSSFAYAFGFLVAGRWMDRVGVKRGLGAAVVAWSLAAIGHALAIAQLTRDPKRVGCLIETAHAILPWPT